MGDCREQSVARLDQELVKIQALVAHDDQGLCIAFHYGNRTLSKEKSSFRPEASEHVEVPKVDLLQSPTSHQFGSPYITEMDDGWCLSLR